MKLTLPYPPSVNHYWRNVKGRTLISGQGRLYKLTCGATALQQGAKPMSGPVCIRVTVYRPRKAGDLDNTLKALLDSIKGIAYHDDSQIVHIDARREDDKDNPRAEVEIVEQMI